MWATQLNSSQTNTTIDTISRGIKKSCRMNVAVGASTGGNDGGISGGPFGSVGAAAGEDDMKCSGCKDNLFSVACVVLIGRLTDVDWRFSLGFHHSHIVGGAPSGDEMSTFASTIQGSRTRN